MVIACQRALLGSEKTLHEELTVDMEMFKQSVHTLKIEEAADYIDPSAVPI